MKPLQTNQLRSGFSLFEMLMVLSVLGIMIGIVLPTYLSKSEYELARNRHNAQEISSIYTAAQVAGLNLQGKTVHDTIRKVMVGGCPNSGAFKNHPFSVGGLAENDIESTARHLSLINDQLIYSPDEHPAPAAPPIAFVRASSSDSKPAASSPVTSSSEFEVSTSMTAPVKKSAKPTGNRKRVSL